MTDRLKWKRDCDQIEAATEHGRYVIEIGITGSNLYFDPAGKPVAGCRYIARAAAGAVQLKELKRCAALDHEEGKAK